MLSLIDARRAGAAALVALSLFAITAHAGPVGMYWGGGSGDWLTDANWASPTPDDPANQTFSGSIASFGYLGGGGTLQITGDLALSVFNENSISGFTFDFNGHAMSVSDTFFTSSTTFDFAGGAATFASTATSNTNITSLVVTNYEIGSDSLRFGTSASGLSGAELSHIVFDGYSLSGAAQIDANGYVTPLGVSLAAVPEPSACAVIAGMLALGGAFVVRRARRV